MTKYLLKRFTEILPAKKLPVLLVSCLSGMALAEQAFITDSFKITVRSGESSGHRVLGVLATGDSVNVIKRNATSGYAKIKARNGLQGYVLQRHLSQKPTAQQRLTKLEKELALLEGTPDELRQKMLETENQYAELKKAHATLQRTSAHASQASNERNKLRKKIADLTRNNAELKQEKIELENQHTQRWFLMGTGVTLGGILIGLLLPRLQVNRSKESWRSL